MAAGHVPTQEQFDQTTATIGTAGFIRGASAIEIEGERIALRGIAADRSGDDILAPRLDVIGGPVLPAFDLAVDRDGCAALGAAAGYEQGLVCFIAQRVKR